MLGLFRPTVDSPTGNKLNTLHNSGTHLEMLFHVMSNVQKVLCQWHEHNEESVQAAVKGLYDFVSAKWATLDLFPRDDNDSNECIVEHLLKGAKKLMYSPRAFIRRGDQR